jgi:hypothetical protein
MEIILKLLIVGMSESVHARRWISQIANLGWDIRFFALDDISEPHPDLRSIVVYSRASFRSKHQAKGSSGMLICLDPIYRLLNGPNRLARLISRAKAFLGRPNRRSRADRLAKAIFSFQPDIVHSMETQGAGYLTVEAKRLLKGHSFPTWLHTNWGSDIYLFGRLAAHASKIRDVLAGCDYYSCECERDVALARQFGFTGGVLPVFPNSGGFDLAEIIAMRKASLPPSQRRTILLKGYQGWAGRAFCGIRALSRAKDVLGGYSVFIYSNDSTDMKIAAELLAQEAGIQVTVLEPHIPHAKMLELHGRARISIGLSISDAISTSFLEAMVMGSFPIQSWTSAANEWIIDGQGGILVPPEDPDIIEVAIRRALADDGLVDRAAALSWPIVANRLDAKHLRDLAVQGYESILARQK